jgi:hypothetical protein
MYALMLPPDFVLAEITQRASVNEYNWAFNEQCTITTDKMCKVHYTIPNGGSSAEQKLPTANGSFVS